MPLFEHYAADATALDSAGGKSITQQESFNTLKTNISGREDAAVSQVSGDLVEQVQTSGESPKKDSEQLGRATVLVGGATKHFSSAIKTYNGHIDDLNEEYENAKAANFNVNPDDVTTDDMTDAEKSSAIAEAEGEAETDLKADLEKKRKGYEETLNEAGDYAAKLLNGEPDDRALLGLFLLGDLNASEIAQYTGITVGSLNGIRANIASVKGAIGLKDALPALTQYLTKINFKSLQGRLDFQTELHLKQIVRMSRSQNLSFAQRLANYKNAKLDVAQLGKVLRGQNLVKAATPGALFGKYGANAKYFGKFSSGAGKLLAPLGALSGAWTVGDTIANWNEKSASERTYGLVGGGSAAIAGGLGTAALVMGAAFPPALAAAGIVAGTVALGTMVVQNWDSISNFATETVPDALGKVGEGIGKGIEEVGDFLGF